MLIQQISVFLENAPGALRDLTRVLGMGKIDLMALSIADTQIDSPYNTYMYAGFPIGPICNPGTECIEAALYPEATDAYYFVLGKDGSHIFSKTYEEHLAAMQSTEQNISVDDSAIENQDSLKQ